MKGPRLSRARQGSGEAVERIIADALASPQRLVASHCPHCCEPHREEPLTSWGMWIEPDLFYRTILYQFCRRCERRFEKAGRKARKRMFHLVEEHLVAMGVTMGIERAKVRA